MPNPRASYTDPDAGFATLTGVTETIYQSMPLLKIAALYAWADCEAHYGTFLLIFQKSKDKLN